MRRGKTRSGRHERSSEIEVPPLPEQAPVGELFAEGEAAILKAKDVKHLVVHELGAAFFGEVRLDFAQVLGT